MKNRLFRKSLVTKVLLSYILCLIVTVSIVVIYTYKSMKEYTIKDLNEKADAQVQMLILKCEKLFGQTEQIAYDISYMVSAFSLRLNNNDIYESLVESLIWNKNIKSITIAYLSDKDKVSDYESVKISLDPEHKHSDSIYYSYPKDIKGNDDSAYAQITHKNFCEEEWFEETLKCDGGWIGEHFNQGIISYVYPIFSCEGEKYIEEGVVKVDLKLEWLVALISKVEVYENGFCTFLSKDGDMLGRNGTVLNVFEYAEDTKNPSVKDVLKKIMVKESAFARYYNPELGQWFLLFAYPYESWWFGIMLPEKEFFEEMFIRISRLLIIGLICLLIPIPVIVYLTLKQTKFLSKLTDAAVQIGAGNFDAELPELTTEDEVGILSRAFVKMKKDIKNHIENVRLMTEAKQQIEHELNIAKKIQRSIIPSNFPDIKEIEFSAFINPAKTVGGDFYDFFFIDETHFCFMIGDVSGKSISGAMFMALSRTMIRSRLTSGLSLTDAINSVNKSINEENTTSMFLTFFAAILDIRTGELETCNAGHCPPALCRNSHSFEYFVSEKVMPALGMIDFKYITRKLTLIPGDILFLYTDGVTESVDINQNFFEEQSLLNALDECVNSNMKELLIGVYQAVASHQGKAEQSDDICMVVLRYKGI